jgi:hypothetical protein
LLSKTVHQNYFSQNELSWLQKHGLKMQNLNGAVEEPHGKARRYFLPMSTLHGKIFMSKLSEEAFEKTAQRTSPPSRQQTTTFLNVEFSHGIIIFCVNELQKTQKIIT